jgi:hypothetical protein
MVSNAAQIDVTEDISEIASCGGEAGCSPRRCCQQACWRCLFGHKEPLVIHVRDRGALVIFLDRVKRAINIGGSWSQARLRYTVQESEAKLFHELASERPWSLSSRTDTLHRRLSGPRLGSSSSLRKLYLDELDEIFRRGART